jgi:TPR repeat protein
MFDVALLPSTEKATDANAPRVYSTDPFSLALLLWVRAANQGNVEARIKVGDYHYHGKGGNAVDYKKAAAYYLTASDSEFHPMAMWNMGWMYENGIGVAQVFPSYFCHLLLLTCYVGLLFGQALLRQNPLEQSKRLLAGQSVALETCLPLRLELDKGRRRHK